MRVVVCGLIAQYPLGGVAWDYLQYVLGLKEMGCDVFYLEDTGQWPFNPQEAGVSKDCLFNVEYLNDLMSNYDLGDRWSYRFPWEGRWYGMATDRRKEVLATADALLNVSGCLRDPTEYREVRRLCFIDSDPVFTQLKILRGQEDFVRGVASHDFHFTFGEALAAGRSTIPDTTFRWLPTRQPVVLSEWSSGTGGRPYTTIMNWTSYKDVSFNGQAYGQKDKEFGKYLDLPAMVPELKFEIAMNDGKTRRSPKAALERRGWKIVDPNIICPDMDSYRDFIQSSRGEWSVAKHGYVAGRSGWFSCRSACYLAAGRPVVVQSTGFEEHVRTGDGLLSFSDPAGAILSLREIEHNYQHHTIAARQVAEEYFDSQKVLGTLLRIIA